MKKFLLFLTLLLCTVFGTVGATEVTIGELEGAANSSNLPMNSLYEYSYSQQIYTAGEIGMAGTINSITLWMYGNANLYDMPIDIYMVETDKDAFSSNTDWVTVSAGDIVYSGSVTVHNTDAQAFTFNLTTPFVYNGTGNLLIAVNNQTGAWKSGLNGMVFGVSSDPVRAIHARKDGSAYDPTTPTFTANSTTHLRNVIKLDITPGGGTVCDKPSDMTVSNVESTSAVLAWAGGSGSYNVDYKKASESEWTPLLSGSTMSSTTLSGLQPGTAYQVRVQSVCTDGTSAYKSVSFTTLYGVPFVEEFATTSLPANWSRYATLLTDDVLNGTTPITSYNGGWNFGNSNGVFDSHAKVNIYGTNCSYWLVTPAVEMAPNAQLTFDLALTAYNGTVVSPATTGTDDKFVVLISTDDGATWSILRQWDNAGSAYVYNDIACSADGEEVVIDLSAYSSGSVMIAFYTESTVNNADNNLHIDNVKVDEIPSCFKPTSLKVSDLTTSDAFISWKKGATEWEWRLQYKKSSETEWTTIENVNNVYYSLTGLEAYTDYDVRVAAKCGGDISDYSNELHFTTIAGVPFVEEFATTSLPANWSKYTRLLTDDVLNGTSPLPSGGSWNFGASNGVFDNHARVNVYGVSCTSWLVTPNIYLHTTGVQLTFDLALTAYSGTQGAPATTGTDDRFVVLLSYDDGATWTILRQWDNAGSADVYNDIPVSGMEVAIPEIQLYTDLNVKLAFYAESTVSNADNNLHIDNVKLDYIPSCVKPTGLSVSDIEAHAATLTWTSDASAWQVCLEGGEASPIDVTAKSYTFTGLDAETNYVAKVRTDCGGSYSDWVSKAFTTLASCPTPTNLAASDLTSTGATLTWTPGGSETEWEVQYTTDSEFAYAYTEIVNGTPTLALTGLTPETKYYARVQAHCSGTDGDSEFSDVISFTTAFAVPFEENFDNTSIPAGWRCANTLLTDDVLNGTTPITFYNGGWSFGNYNGVFDTHAKVNIYGTGCKYWLVTPAVEMAPNVQLTFDLALTAYSGNNVPAPATTGTDDKFVVLISTDDGATWSILRQWDNAGSAYVYNDITNTAEGEEVSLDLSAYSSGSVMIAFYGESTASNADNNLHIDNVKVDEIQSCVKPTGLAVSDITKNSATLTWKSDATAWQVCLEGGEASPIDVTAKSYTFSGLNANTDYVAKVRTDCGTDGYSDWVSVNFKTPEACPAPTDLVLDAVNKNSATISWSWPGIPENQFGVAWYLPSHIQNAVFSDDFEGDLSQWTIYTEGDVNAAWILYDRTASSYSIIPHSGDKAAWARSYDNESGTSYSADNWLVSPQITLPASGTSLSYWVFAPDKNYPDSYEVLLSTTDNAIGSFTTVLRSLAPAPDTKMWENVIIDLSAYAGQQVYIAFHHVDNDMFYLFIDDVQIGEYVDFELVGNADASTTSYEITGLQPETRYALSVAARCGEDGNTDSEVFYFTTLASCFKPTNLDESNITVNSADIAWTAGGDETAWAIEYKPRDAAEWTVVNVNTNTYQLTGLAKETTYNVRIKALCAEDDHSAYAVTSFTTLASCFKPTNLGVSNITVNSADIAWTAGGDETAWAIEYKPRDAAEWTVVNVNTNPYQLTGLAEKTTYDVRIKALCAEDDHSSYTATAFTTDFGTGWIHYDDGVYATSIGSGSPQTWTWGIKIPAPLSDNVLAKVALYEQSAYLNNPVTLNVYNIESSETPASTGVTELYSETFDALVNGTYHIIPLTTPVSVDTNKDLWITFTTTSVYPMASAATQGNANGRWVLNGTEWVDLMEVAPTLEYDWMIRAYLTSQHNVTFVDYNDAVIAVVPTLEGQAAIAPADPTRVGYTFTGWDTDFSNVTSDLTVKAQYSINMYNVTVIAGDWSTTQNLPYGTPIAALLAAAIEEAGGQYMTVDKIYTFAGWDPEPETILTGDATYTALYTSEPRPYTVTFKDWNGTVLLSGPVNYGTAASAPANPTREGYNFTGWDVDFSNITGDLVVTAQYTINTYTVTFKDWDGTVLKSQTLNWHNSATPPADPTREGYTFTGWDGDYTNLESDVVVTAQYTINQYTVTFKNWDGTTLKTQTVDWNTAATAPVVPAREGYTFTGWDKAFDHVKADMTVTALFSINQYTVTFKNWDGTTLKTQTVDWNTAATAPVVPAREGYTFTGWDKAFTNVTANLTVTAQFAINTYTVTFKDWDGTVLKSQTVNWNEAATAPANPTREGYTFAGWDKAFDHVKADMTVTAQYTINSYTVTFKDWDGTVLKTQTVEYGQAATAPADPIRSGWTFSGWDKAFNVITSDLVVTARYTQNPVYTVNFVDWDETVISTQSVEQGQAAIAPANPVREGYTFTGWDATFTNVTSNMTIHAQYTINSYTLTYKVDGETYGVPQTLEYGAAITPEPAPAERVGYTFSGWSEIPATMPAHDVVITGTFVINHYTVTFVDWKDDVIGAPQDVIHGAAAIAPVAPLREGYTFTGWDKDFSVVTSNLTVKALYRINTFTVTFKDWNGTVLKSQTVNWNAAAEAPANPSREGYTFIGWDKEFGIITADLVVTAQYTINQYTVVFKDWDGATLKTEVVNWNEAATAPANPSREGYNFTGWDKAFNHVKADMTVTAVYSIKQFTVTFKDWDGATLSTQTVNWNAAAIAPANPSREGYTFTGWDKTFTNVKANLTVTAQYEINTYVVTFVDYNGTVLKTQTVNWNAAAVAPANPSREGYTFTGWDKAFDHVKSALTVTAQYRINVYRLSYMAEGAEVAFDSIAYMAPVDVTLHNGDAPVKAGHTFNGWAPAITNMPAHNDTVTAVYTINTFTVVFKDYNGTVLKTQTVDWNTAATAPANPSREGYNFIGWDKNFEHVTENMIVTAQYEILTFTVTFKDWDGTVLKTQTVEYGQAATAPADPIRSGWTFSGWDKAFNVITSDLVVTARYTQNPVYTVNFVDWDETVISTQSVEQGQAAIAPANPVREGYTFTGWDATFTNVTSNMTIHAQYTINSYTLTYKVDGETYGVPQTLTYGAAITPMAAPAREGYTFSGWSEIPATMPAHDVVITGTFTINKYHLTYMVDGAVYGAVEEIEFNAPVVLRAEPTREGYTFSGWQGGVANMPAHDVVISGSFTVNTYRLTYMVDGVEFAYDSIAYGATITLRPAPAREGYTFSGWSAAPTTMPANDVVITGSFTVNTYNLIYKVDGEIYSQNMVAYGTELIAIAAPADREGYTFSGWSEIPATMPAHDVTITGSFSINSYNLIYMVDGEVYATQTLQYGATITLKPAPTKTGYTFSGWSAAPTTMPAHDVTVSGTFTIMTFTVIFKDYDGTVLSTQTVNYGEPAIAPADPTREGYTFAGWNQAFNSVTSDMEIVARYTQNTVYTVIFVDWDETVISTQQVEQGQAAIAPADPIREGYTFTGWDASFSNVTSNMTIHAQYTINIYNVTFVAGTWTRSFPLPYGTDLAALEQQVYVMIGGRTIVNTDSIYTLVAWSPELAPVTADVTYTAIYEAVARQYLIVFVNGNDTLFTDSVDYGQIPVYEGEIPTKPSDEQYNYTFSGWDPEIAAVSGDAVYTAVFDAQPIEPGTGLIRPEAEEKVEKFIMEDKIYIRRGGRLYSAQGHLIQ